MLNPSTVRTARVPLVLVDDDRDTREMYCSWLEFAGFEVFSADNAESAFAYAVTHQPRVVVTDHVLKQGSTGAELCRRLKDDARTEHIPTLLMTGVSERTTAEGALDAGCAVVRLKPYLPDAMLADLKAIIKGVDVAPFPSEHRPR